MGKRISGTFNGTGSALYIGIGFVPDWVWVLNLEGGEAERIYWNKHMTRTAEITEGLMQHDDEATAPDLRTVADGGIRPYRSWGNKLSSASTAYLKRDDNDYRTSDTYGTIDTWTLGSSTNRTGNWNVEADTTYVGEGSQIIIAESVSKKVIQAAVVALTSNGEAANEVTLSEVVNSGTIYFLGRMYDYVGGASGDIIQDGFSLHETTDINVSGEMCMFEAGTFDN